MDYSSKLLARAVDEIAQLPGIGKRSALRLALHLLKQPQAQTQHLTEALMALRSEINFVPTVTTSPTNPCVKFVPIPNAMQQYFVWLRTYAM